MDYDYSCCIPTPAVERMAAAVSLGYQHRFGVRLKRAATVMLYTAPPPESTVWCADELVPMSSRTFPPAPGRSRDGHRIKAPLDYGRGPDKGWVSGALHVRDGQAMTSTTPSRNTAGYRQLLNALATANPAGGVYAITDNLASHKSPPIQEWLARHLRAPARLHSQSRLLAQSPGSLVALVPPGSLRWLELRGSYRARLWRVGRHPPAQPPGQAVGLAPPRPAAQAPSPPLCVLPLRNGALMLLR